MLFPKKVKHRKWHSDRKGTEKLVKPETRGVTLAFGSYGLKAQSQARVFSNQLEAARRAMARELGKTAKSWTRIFPDRPITQKAAEVPMGKGKGDLKGYCFDVRPGRMIFEVDGVSAEVAMEALRKAGTKLPVKTKIISRK